MSEKDKTIQDINSGKGLPPLNPQSSGNSSGLTTEQRSDETGLRKDWYTLNRQSDSKG